jgi:dTDP-4-amino-4,6-dideoxygalactose transaminase
MSRPPRTSFLVFGAPRIERDEIDEVVQCLESGWVGTGPRAARFEEDFARYKGVPRAVAVNSCTAALHLSVLAAGIGPGDEVITTPMTFCATINAIIHAGATPVLADVDPVTKNVDPAQVERKITARTRAIVPVHFGGYPCDMDPLLALAERHGLRVIEDCAHAIEAEYRGRKTGTFGDFGCFSFYVTKNIITGEGGMIVARSEDALARIKVLALHGMSRDAWKRFGDSGYKHYQVVDCGFKYNMMDLQAAIGIHQLRRIERCWERRRVIWRRYDEAFAGLPLDLPAAPVPWVRHAYHLYAVQLREREAGLTRDAFLEEMTRRKIGVGVHYLAACDQPYYQERFRWAPQDYPVASDVGRRTVSLPLSPRLTDEDVEDVVDAVRSVLHG